MKHNATQSLLRVYPRVCGGTDCEDVWIPNIIGLSPRVRGNQVLYGHNERP